MPNKDEISCYENRELSWLRFNERVLEEARNPAVPLMERLSFLSIFQSNLDEFFMVRVGSLEDQKFLKKEVRDNKTGMTSEEQLRAIASESARLCRLKDATYQGLMDEVGCQGFFLTNFQEISEQEEDYLHHYFLSEIYPLLSVMIVGRKQPFPFLRNKEIYAMAVLETKSDKKKIGIIPCSSQVFPRLIKIPTKKNTYMLSEELILHFLPRVFREYKVTEKTLLRITRNADIDMSQAYDEDLDYRDYMAQIIKQRKKLSPVRLELTRNLAPEMTKRLRHYFELEKERMFLSGAPLDLSFVGEIQDIMREKKELFFAPRTPQKSTLLKENEPLIPQILDHDVLLSYPYENIKPFLSLLQEAANDPKVISIRMTLYRLASHSKIVDALVEAAENGKQVDVLVELKARFDEENNIEWSRTLEQAGCHVVYGVDGLKVHSKLCLITRKDGDDLQYITQIGTGNYNEKTARLYTDLSLITSRMVIGKEAADVFSALLLGEVVEECEHLMVAPRCLQNKILEKIDREMEQAKNGGQGYIGVKINSLTDKKIIDRLIEASQAGVKIELLIRGINCLHSGIEGKTDNIEVHSIVGRFLEHSRIYIFGTPDRDEIYIASADFMTRNTLRRVEVAAPIYDDKLKLRIREMFVTMFSDNVKGRIQQPDGSYQIPQEADTRLDSQEYFYEQAYENAREAIKKPAEE